MVKLTVVGSQNQGDFTLNRNDINTLVPINNCDWRSKFKIESKDSLPLELYKRSFEFQNSLGLDLFSEGELFRADKTKSDYIYYFRHAFKGIKLEKNKQSVEENYSVNNNFYVEKEIEWSGPLLVQDWKLASSVTNKEIKINIPGPFSMVRVIDSHCYNDNSKLAYTIAEGLNKEIKALIEAGCKWIQIDDPFLCWDREASNYAYDALKIMLNGIEGINIGVHLCDFNPYSITNDFSIKQQKALYEMPYPYYKYAISMLKELPISFVSLVFPGNYQDYELSSLADKKMNILLGVVHPCIDTIESTQSIIDKVNMIRNEIDLKNLYLTPNCGIKHLSNKIVYEKFKHMVEAKNILNLEYKKNKMIHLG